MDSLRTSPRTLLHTRKLHIKIQACLPCRGRKTKCNGARPSCGACVAQQRPCEYDEAGPKKRARVAGSRRDKQAKVKAARLEGASLADETTSPEIGDAVPVYVQDETAQTHAERPLLVSQSPAPSEPATRQDTPDVDVSQYVVLDGSGTVRVRGPTNTLYESGTEPHPAGPKVQDASASNPYASAILTASAAIERQKEAQYRVALLSRGEIEGIPAELALHLLDIHWNRHHFFLLTYRPAFVRDMMGSGPFYSTLLFFAIMAVSCRYSERPEVGGGDHAAHSGRAFYEKAQRLLMDELGKSSIPTATALLLMGNALVSAGQVDRGWLYTGMGIRMITNMGLHVEMDRISTAKDQRTVEEIEISRRLFWGAYVSEKLQSLYLGRPVFLHERDCHVPKKFLDIYEEDETWRPFPSHETVFPVMATNSISNFTALCVISEICEDIMSSFYPVKAKATTKEALQSCQARIRGRLSAWITDLPAKLRCTPWNDKTQIIPIHGVVLHTIYLSLVILLERPFVANGHLNQGYRNEGSWLECTVAAEKIAYLLHAYRETYSFRCVPYQLCYATYVASTILVRNASTPDRLGGHVPSAKQLAVCLKGFHEMKVAHPGTERMEERIRALMGRLDVSVADQAFPSPSGDLLCQHNPSNHIHAWSPNLLSDRLGADEDIAADPSHRHPSNGAYIGQQTLGSQLLAVPDCSGADLVNMAEMGISGSIPYSSSLLGDSLWDFPMRDINDDILFGVLRDSWS